jgi:hypothetical protein
MFIVSKHLHHDCFHMINANAFFSILTFHNDIYSFVNDLSHNVSIFTWSLPEQHMFICQMTFNMSK